MIKFDSDYLEGAHPAVLAYLTKTNLEQTPGYGEDCYCQQAAELIRKACQAENAHVHFLVGGTQANTTVIAAALRPYEGALTADTGHINVHETGAIESSGHKVLALPGKDGKITADQVREAVALQADFEHTVKPGMVYISLPTELGTMYSKAELMALYAACQELRLLLFVDGARLGYGLSAPSCDITLADLARFTHVFTIGGTKVGALFGEAVVILDEGLHHNFRYMIKQRGGMLAKGRLLGLQFLALMEDDLYFALGKKATAQALRIQAALKSHGIPLLIPSPTNQQFPIFTDGQLAKLEKDFTFGAWEQVDEHRQAVRICTSWATPDASVDRLIQALEAL